LDVDNLENIYEQSKRRLIIVDSDGVLPVKINPQGKEEPSPEAISVLDTLSKDPNTIVFVVSPGSKTLLHRWYHKTENLGLAAENGFFWKWNSKEMPAEADWNTLIEVEDFQWIH